MAKIENANSVKSPIALWQAAVTQNATAKITVDASNNSAFRHMFHACGDNDTLVAVRTHLERMKDADEKLRELGNAQFADFCGAAQYLTADGKKTDKYNNMMKAAKTSAAFGVDIHSLGFATDIGVTANGTYTVKGNSRLMTAIRSVLEWTEKTGDPEIALWIVGKVNEAQAGEKISWAKLAYVINAKSGRNKASASKSVSGSVTSKKPLAALALVSKIVADGDTPQHFTSLASRMMALDTSEDIGTFAFAGEDAELIAIRKKWEKVNEELRAYLQSRMNATHPAKVA